PVPPTPAAYSSCSSRCRHPPTRPPFPTRRSSDLTMHAAWKLDTGDFARKEVSMAKVVVSETLHKAVDTAIQLCGARGYSRDTPLEWIYRYARQARLVDGASEVHKMVLSRNLMKEGNDFWSWG